jgi:Uma2 family endonuclease
VRRHERQDRTIVGAFADWTGQQLRERAPDIPRIFSAKESLLIYLKYFTGAIPS